MDLRWRSLIMKTGLALLFVISFCEAKSKISPRTPAHTLAAQTGAAHFEERIEQIRPDKSHSLRKRSSNEDDLDYEVYQGVVGRPGIDFPILPRIPQTTFSCRTFGNGYFADLETECQVFHICEEGRKISFLCPNGTIFQQSELTCDWWFKVNCAGSPGLYAESAEMLSRAQNRAKQRSQTAKNEFHSSEHDYSNERNGGNGNGYKNQYPVKSGIRKPTTQSHDRPVKKPLTRRIDSDEIPSGENFDFEDISTSRQESTERSGGKLTSFKPNPRSKFDSSLESQDVAETSSFFGNNGNIKNTKQRNGYVYEDPSGTVDKKVKNNNNNNNKHNNNNNNNNNNNRNGDNKNVNVNVNGKSRGNERGRQRFEGDDDTKNVKNSGDNDNYKGNRRPNGRGKIQTEPPPLVHLATGNGKHTTVKSHGGGSSSGTYSTSKKFDTSGTTPYYTPTIPALGGKTTKQIPSNIRTTTARYSEATTPTKYSDNLGFSFATSTPQFDVQTTLSPLNKQSSTSTSNQLIIGMRGNVAENNNLNNRNSVGNSKQTTVNYRGNNRGTVTTYSPSTSTSYRGSPTYLSKSTTATSYITTSTSGPTYLPTTTNRPSSSGPTYLPKEGTTYRPSSSGPTYLPKTTTRLPKNQDIITTHVKEMIKSLNDLKVDTKDLDSDVNKFLGKSSRIGLEIPPSSGPETLASLASYFAGDDEKLANTFGTKKVNVGTTASGVSLTTETSPTSVKVIQSIESGLLTNKTVGNYDQLFGLKTNIKTTLPSLLPDVLSPEFVPRSQDDNDLEGQHSNGPLGDSIGKPETRKIAQVFTNALTRYLEDPVQFKRVLNEVRPTEPPNSEELFVTGAPGVWRRPTKNNNNKGSTYNARPTTTFATPTATGSDDLEVLDFSDVTINTNGNFGIKQSTTKYPSETISSNSFDRGSVTRFSKTTKKIGSGTTTQSNNIAAEVNKEFDSSTLKPLSLAVDLLAPDFVGSRTTTKQPDIFTNPPLLAFDILPPKSKLNADLSPRSNIDDDEDTLQRAQSQSFVASRNNQFAKDQKSNRIGKVTKQPTGHFITGTFKTNPSTTTEIPDFIKTTQNPWTHLAQTVYLDPLTINDGLMNKYKTTTSSPFTYLPKSTLPPTTPKSKLYINLGPSLSLRNGEYLDATIVNSRTPKTKINISDLTEDLLPPRDGMKRIAQKMFGGLNDSQADHLMNVMKKAETNQVVRRLILLLIQTCDEDYSKTVDQSRQALLNALIGMDSKFEFDEEVEVIKLKPRRQKSIGSAKRNGNLIETTTIKIPVTTYRRRSFDLISSRTTTNSPQTSTTDYPAGYSTTISPRPEDTTRFEIRVEDLDDDFTSTSTIEPEQNFSTTTTSTNLPTETSTTWYSSRTTTSSPPLSSDYTTTIKPIGSGKAGSRRKAKDLEGFLGQETDLSNQNSHKSSDERALDLLKSLYSLASKFGRR